MIQRRIAWQDPELQRSLASLFSLISLVPLTGELNCKIYQVVKEVQRGEVLYKESCFLIETQALYRGHFRCNLSVEKRRREAEKERAGARPATALHCTNHHPPKHPCSSNIPDQSFVLFIYIFSRLSATFAFPTDERATSFTLTLILTTNSPSPLPSSPKSCAKTAQSRRIRQVPKSSL